MKMTLRMWPTVPRFSNIIRNCPPALLQYHKNNGSRYCNTLAEAEKVSAPRTSVRNPSLHTHEHLGLWYTIEPDTVKRLYSIGGFPKKFATMCETFAETSLMVREPSLTVIDYIRRSNLALPPNKFLLYGRDGVGKTLSLAHILHFLAEDGWLLLHVWWAPMWRRSFKEVTASSTNPGCFDHPIEASVWLQHFRTQNSELLKELQLTTSEQYTWSRREATEAGSPLTALVDHGINRTRYATDAVMALTTELKKHASEGRCKVAVVADGINSFFCPTSRHKVDGVFVEPERFILYKAFMHFFNNDWKNGCILGTIDMTANDGARRDSYLPRYLLRQKGWETLDPFVPVPVDDYDEREMRSIVDYYVDREWLQTVDGSLEEARRELAAYTNHNPRNLMEVCRSL